MHTQYTAPFTAVSIRRDASTTAHVCVPEYELPILEHLFGAQFVERGDVLLDLVRTCCAHDEAERLAQKYGQAAVEAVFGHGAKRLKEAMQEAAAAAVKEAPRRGRPRKEPEPAHSPAGYAAGVDAAAVEPASL